MAALIPGRFAGDEARMGETGYRIACLQLLTYRCIRSVVRRVVIYNIGRLALMEILFATNFGGPPSLLTAEVGPCKRFPASANTPRRTIPCGLVLIRARSLKTE